MLSEHEGCEVLTRVFEAHGYQLQAHHPLSLPSGARVSLDGYDPQQKVGFEYITNEAGDRQELTPEVIEELEDGIEAGHFMLLLVDELDISDAAELEQLARRFLERRR